ncbi:MAG: hypothetical protein DWQ19_12430 [Crenarchaeota archaeon]|nr:MAG: hypothetical protein DWQ19_12430 [Thermoproteota archaeon]
MSICLEYLTRTKLLETLISFPCSVFDTDRQVAISINKKDDDYTLQQWRLSELDQNDLPLIEETVVKNPFEEICKNFPDIKLLQCESPDIPSKDFRPRHTVKSYLRQFDGYLKFDQYNKIKERWLWNIFINLYCPQLAVGGMSIKRSIGIYDENIDLEIMSYQKQAVATNYPDIHPIWTKWDNCLLNFNGVPGEFILKQIYLPKKKPSKKFQSYDEWRALKLNGLFVKQ